MHHSKHTYHHDEHELHGYLAYAEKDDKPKPTVLVVHDWSGQNEFAQQKAKMFAKLGYVGFAVDMYGLGKVAKKNEEKEALMHPLIQDRLMLRTRIQAALDTVVTLPQVDKQNVAVLGYCFGGLCALDLARSGAEIKGAISVHGLLSKPEDLPNQTIEAKVLVLQGAEDPMVSPTAVETFCDEMTAEKVDWQVHTFGQTKHAFTNPHAHDTDNGLIYSALAARRSTLLIDSFLEEIFG
ncbi:MAG: dienelactone hydrolase family protein [Gammaproteobacteria bacterium]|nr:dienelactone hydrolase family protein [Gammaproteobacteria bacterium]